MYWWRLQVAQAGSYLEKIQGEAAPADRGLAPLVWPQPDLGQQNITDDWAPSKPAGPEVQGRLILRGLSHA